MTKQNEINWTILEDGTITVETGDLGGPNHHSADELLEQLAEAMGGEVKKSKRSKFHVHADLGGALKEHTHDGHTHAH